MNLYPAIDLYEGQVVRLTRGDFAQKKVYSEQPELVAKTWTDDGAEWIHIVDLEASKLGVFKNLESLKKIRASVTSKIEFGGGVRDLDGINILIHAGVDRVILGTKALDPVFLEAALHRFGSKIAVSLDAKDGIIQTQGWLTPGRETLDAAIDKLNQTAVETIIYTDIQKDGMLQGPNLSGLVGVLNRSKPRVILSGGISSLEDIRQSCQIKKSNFEGIIVGRALYEKKFSVRDALSITRKP